MSKGGPEAVDVKNEPWAPLQPYLSGANPGQNLGAPVPLNYNWLNWAQNIGGGMPSAAPPMSMDDPRMTFENVHTPYAGGPWGYGMGPGMQTAEAGIPMQGAELPAAQQYGNPGQSFGGMGFGGKGGGPFGSQMPPGGMGQPGMGQPGGNFLQPPADFAPGRVNPIDTGGGATQAPGLDMSMLDQAMDLARRSRIQSSFGEGDETFRAVDPLQALRFYQENPSADGLAANEFMQGILSGRV